MPETPAPTMRTSTWAGVVSREAEDMRLPPDDIRDHRSLSMVPAGRVAR
jgi:hypothetical protein